MSWRMPPSELVMHLVVCARCGAPAALLEGKPYVRGREAVSPFCMAPGRPPWRRVGHGPWVADPSLDG